MAVYDVTDYGAAGDGVLNDAAGIQKAIDACRSAGGGRVLLGGGKTYRSGSIELKANIDFHVETGSRLIASDSLDDYYISPYDPEHNHIKHVFIHAENAENLRITGGGAIDGNAMAFLGDETPTGYEVTCYPRPTLLLLVKCDHLTVRDITLTNTSFWTLHLAGCDDVLVEGIRILNGLKVPNADGIDPDHCRNVRIANCHVEAGDDCICLKNGPAFADFGPTENVTVSGCTLKSTSAAIKIGTESCDDFRNIVFDNCAISGSHRGLSIQVRDTCTVENVRFSNMTIETRRFGGMWWGSGEPIYVTALPRDGATAPPKVRNVSFHNITCRSENGVYLAGTAASPLEDITLENVRIEVDKWTKYPGGTCDRRPCAGEQIVSRDTAGIYAEHADGLAIRNCQVKWGPNIPDYFGDAIETREVTHLVLENFRGTSARNGDSQAIE